MKKSLCASCTGELIVNSISHEVESMTCTKGKRVPLNKAVLKCNLFLESEKSFQERIIDKSW